MERSLLFSWLRRTLLTALIAGASLHTNAFAQDTSLPPRSAWRATASSIEPPAIAPPMAIDGDLTTRWGGAFSANHWLQIDLSRPAPIGGVLIRWDSGFAEEYLIQTSLDGSNWRTSFETVDGKGDIDYVFFPTVSARYVRIASPARTADWGVSIFEFEPLAARESPRIVGLAGAGAGDAGAAWSKVPARALGTAGTATGTRVLRIELPRPLSLSGLEVWWGAARSSAKLEAKSASGQWRELAQDPEALGDNSYLAAKTAATASELRLTVRVKTEGAAPAITRMRLLSPSQVLTPTKRYEVASTRANPELFPKTLHREQVYWTTVGIPGGKQKSIFDEYGNIEAFKGAPLVQPIWRDASGRASAASGPTLKQTLQDGWKPIPTVEWSPQPGVQVSATAIGVEYRQAPVTLVRYRVANSSQSRVAGQLALVVRPIQVNPPWQHGGVSPINRIAIEGEPAQTSIRIDGRVFAHSLSTVDARGAAPFGTHGETELTRNVAAGTVPAQLTAQDPDGLAAALLSYRVELVPGAHRDVVLAFPLGNEPIDVLEKKLPASPAIDRTVINSQADAGVGFGQVETRTSQEWQARFGKIGFTLPDHSLVDTLRAQAAYMLINQTGHAMQPGPRNYNRSFIRDGSATAAVLARMGMASTARDYAKWYADHAVHENGLVSPILNEDGSVNKGFGSDIEFDAQGEFIWMIAEIARLDGGTETVRDYQPKVKLAMKFLQELRERTLKPGYMSDREAPERFRGIIAPSISHEGYSTPTHSYWDDYWALKGWHDGAWLMESWGDKETAKWAREQYELLRTSVAASIRATMAWRKIDFMPAAADLGDGDPTSVSIGVDPCDQLDIMPADTLKLTFDRYLDDVRKRDVPNALYAYTPYEIRNVLTYVHLNRPQDAMELLGSLVRHRRPAGWHVFGEVVHSRIRRDRYLGDMPHTWIGSEYVRAVLGMIMREGDERLHLLPGTPVAWTRGEGAGITDLPTAYGKLTMSAKAEGNRLRVTLGEGVRAGTAVDVSWPSRKKPTSVTVDGKATTSFDANGIKLDKPFRELVATW
jgi:hypothetical protein